MADLDGDGVEDLVSGSWPGEIHFFKGTGRRSFAAGKVIFRPGKDTVNPDFNYSALQSASPWVHDWEGDGDLDLVVGMIWGTVHLLRNTGTPKEPEFADPVEIQPGGRSLKAWGLHKAGPCVADWDGDGMADLVIGDERNVWWCRCEGRDKNPVFAAPVKLVSGEDLGKGYRFKPCVADWNGDGLPDLLVGSTFSGKGPDGKRLPTTGFVWVLLRERGARTE